MARILILTITHVAIALAGFVAGIFALPIIMAPEAPSSQELVLAQGQASYRGEFRRDLHDSDFLHWGEGELSVGPDTISLMGRLAPGPAYKLYLSPEFVETEAAFKALKPEMLQVASIDTFDNFIVPVAPGIDLDQYNTVIIWCESFSQFITAAQYR